MVKRLSKSKFGGVLLIALGLMVSACAPAVSARGLNVAPCHPPTIEGNVYRQAPQSVLSSYYSTAFTNMDFDNPENVQRYETIQYDAIKLLATQTERWSDFIDIYMGRKDVRVTITYLNPELVHTIILNHYLFRKNGSFINGTFDEKIASTMEELASRNEHIFFVTLTASKYEQHTSNNDPVIVQLPLQSLVLTNSSNIQVNPQHDDHNLEERIDLTFNSAHGYFSYPMAVLVNENCEFLLDKTTNTHLVLSIPHIEVNGTRYQTRPWIFDYASLLDIALNPNPMENRLPVDRDPSHFCPCNELPVSITPVNAEYWENLARFIWHEITQDP